ncbi:hypothetical protein ACFE04_028848 [Oxalis oulophora]
MKPSISSKTLFPVLILLLFINTPLISSSSSSSSSQFIKTSCSSTLYPKLCIITLSPHSSLIQTSPKLLTQSALNLSLSTAKSTSILMSRLLLHNNNNNNNNKKKLKAREVAAMNDCLEEITDSVDELRRSVGEMGKIGNSKDFKFIVSDIQTWVSAALTDETSCTDGFEGKGMDGNLKKEVQRLVRTVARMTSNALALINRFANLNA